MKNTIYKLLIIIGVLLLCIACNKEWKDEQFTHYASFKAPLNLSTGTTDIYVRYKPEGIVTYKLPIIVSGSTTHRNTINAHIGLDLDTLANINKEHYNLRKDLYYQVLRDDQYTFPETVQIPGGEDVSLMDIDFSFGNIDLVDKWVLPLTILDDSSFDYLANPRKNYRKAILRVIPFNDYSGVYSSTTMNVYFRGIEADPMTINTRTAFVVDDNTIFFYAGVQDENLLERRCYKIKAQFNKDGTLTLTAEDPNINLKVIGTPRYLVAERMNETLPYLLHRYVTLNLQYEFDDYTTAPGKIISFTVKGSMTMERKINTQIPDEDQAIEW